MTLQDQFIQHLKKFPFLQPKQKQLLTVSGGVDSVVLCDLLYSAGYDFVIAHCNFQLRGAESERDEHFVRGLGIKYGKPVLVKRFDTEEYAATNKSSIQVAARDLRYNWFRDLISKEWMVVNGEWRAFSEENGITIETDDILLTTSFLQLGNLPPSDNYKLNYIFTAHHANDNIETLLMNFFKGTGISGLHGILPVQEKIVRPLLFARKEEIIAYAKERNLDFVEDSSNLSDKYTRNFFRHHLFPLLKEVYPNVEENLLKNIERFTEGEELYKQAINLHKKKLLEYKGNEVHIPVLKLEKISPLPSIVYEIIKDFGFTTAQTADVLSLLKSETGKYVSSTSHRVIKNRNWLIIAPNATNEAANIVIEKNDKKIVFADGELVFEAIPAEAIKMVDDNNIATLDASLIEYPLLLRKWKQGDYFYPLGMKKKKKLSKFFIDKKLSKTEKERIWVLEANKKIVWIAGHRIDDRFKITDSTKKVFKITLNK